MGIYSAVCCEFCVCGSASQHFFKLQDMENYICMAHGGTLAAHSIPAPRRLQPAKQKAKGSLSWHFSPFEAYQCGGMPTGSPVVRTTHVLASEPIYPCGEGLGLWGVEEQQARQAGGIHGHGWVTHRWRLGEIWPQPLPVLILCYLPALFPQTGFTGDKPCPWESQNHSM